MFESAVKPTPSSDDDVYFHFSQSAQTFPVDQSPIKSNVFWSPCFVFRCQLLPDARRSLHRLRCTFLQLRTDYESSYVVSKLGKLLGTSETFLAWLPDVLRNQTEMCEFGRRFKQTVVSIMKIRREERVKMDGFRLDGESERGISCTSGCFGDTSSCKEIIINLWIYKISIIVRLTVGIQD